MISTSRHAKSAALIHTVRLKTNCLPHLRRTHSAAKWRIWMNLSLSKSINNKHNRKMENEFCILFTFYPQNLCLPRAHFPDKAILFVEMQFRERLKYGNRYQIFILNKFAVNLLWKRQNGRHSDCKLSDFKYLISKPGLFSTAL